MSGSIAGTGMRWLARGLAGGIVAASLGICMPAKADVRALQESFIAPPAEARPWTWFHVMSGNMSREGITKDLESLAEVGVGGIVLFHVTHGVSIGPVRFNSEEHLDLITHVAAECERLGLGFSFHNADGWSSTAGPWVTPEMSMKHVVWSEQLVPGGAVDMLLAQPEAQEGYYEDIAVLAFPASAQDRADYAARSQVTASDPDFDIAAVADGLTRTRSHLQFGRDEKGWVQFSYDAPVTIRSLRVQNIDKNSTVLSIEASDDGVNFAPVQSFTKERVGHPEWHLGAAVSPTTARHFRIVLSEPAHLGEVSLSQAERIDLYASRSSHAYMPGAQLPPLSEASADGIVRRDDIRDLTALVDAQGRLSGELPAGNWIVMRFGVTSTGAHNINPSPEGRGLEIDKFDPAAYQLHHDAFIQPIIDRARAVAPTALTGVKIDSYEVGGQNWTHGYADLYEEEFGQSIITLLPLYAGRIVESAAFSDEKLAEIRQFNARLMKKGYFGAFANAMADEGLESYIEGYGYGPFDEIAAASAASMPVGEFWITREDLTYLNGAVSAAHTYNRPIVSAESFTSLWHLNYYWSPAAGKRHGDRAWTYGINNFFFHRFTHQANTHVMPGMTMFRWGSHFDRTQPWWEDGGKAWFAYMARGQHMLRQGLPVSDIALFVGSESPVTCPNRLYWADRIPEGTEFDCVDHETLMNRSSFADGHLVLPHGMRYPLIWWAQDRPPTDAEMARLREAEAAGVPVVYAHLGEDMLTGFAEAGLAPRIESAGALPLFTQRKMGDTHIFFISNFETTARQYDLRIAADGLAAQWWDPVTGVVRPLAGKVGQDGRSQIAMTLPASGSAFLVFDPAFRFTREAPEPLAAHTVLAGEWEIAFDPTYSDIGTVKVPELLDWSTSDISEIRHFSGRATYRKTFAWDGAHGPVQLDLGQVEAVASVRLNGEAVGTVWTAPYVLDITDAVRPGDNVLEIEVANLWTNRLIADAALPDTSGYQQEGWVPERQMVDWYVNNEPMPEGPRRTWATQYFYKPTDPLVPSGLIGPVTILKD